MKYYSNHPDFPNWEKEEDSLKGIFITLVALILFVTLSTFASAAQYPYFKDQDLNTTVWIKMNLTAGQVINVTISNTTGTTYAGNGSAVFIHYCDFEADSCGFTVSGNRNSTQAKYGSWSYSIANGQPLKPLADNFTKAENFVARFWMRQDSLASMGYAGPATGAANPDGVTVQRNTALAFETYDTGFHSYPGTAAANIWYSFSYNHTGGTDTYQTTRDPYTAAPLQYNGTYTANYQMATFLLSKSAGGVLWVDEIIMYYKPAGNVTVSCTSNVCSITANQTETNISVPLTFSSLGGNFNISDSGESPIVVTNCTGASLNNSGNLVYTSYTLGNGSSVYVSAGNVCINNQSYNSAPNATHYTNRTYNCTAGQTTASSFLWGFPNNGTATPYNASLTSDTALWNTTAGYYINKTEYVQYPSGCSEAIGNNSIYYTWLFEDTYWDTTNTFNFSTNGTFYGEPPVSGNYSSPNFTKGYSQKGLAFVKYGSSGGGDARGSALVLNDTNFTTLENWAFSFWINLNSSGEQHFLVYYDKGHSKSVHIDYSSGKIRYYIVKQGVTSDVITTNYSLAVGTWYHVATSYNGSKLIGYLNATNIGSVDSTGGGNTINLSSGLFIPWPHADSEHMNATFDTLHFFNYTIGATELTAWYNAEKPTQIYYPEYNFTSGYSYADQSIWRTNLAYTAITSDNTPTLYLGTNINSSCIIGTCNYNYTSMTTCSNYANCTENNSLTHTCTIPTNLTTTANSLYVSCLRMNTISTSLSGSLNITLLGITNGTTSTSCCQSIGTGAIYIPASCYI